MYKLLFLLLLLPVCAFSQRESSQYFKDTVAYTPVPVDTAGAIVFRRVFDAPNTPKSELYARARVWTGLTFHNARDIIQRDDLDKTDIIIRGMREGDYNLWFTIQLTFKDNRYRVIISQFWVERWVVTGVSVPAGLTSKGLDKYDPDSEYKELRQYNINVKAGADTINNAGGLSKHHEKQVAIRVQLVSDLAGAVLQDIRQAMLRPANGDDF